MPKFVSAPSMVGYMTAHLQSPLVAFIVLVIVTAFSAHKLKDLF
jgi:uncharacterized membrane protein